MYYVLAFAAGVACGLLVAPVIGTALLLLDYLRHGSRFG